MERAAPSNPLAQLARSVPVRLAAAISVAGRLVGAALLVGIAFDQTYDRTQVFTPIIAAAAVASCVPVARLRWFITGLGAGLVFFAGTVLTHLDAGVAVLGCGLIAALASAAWSSHREGIAWTVGIAFLAAVVPLAAAMLAIFFTVEG